MNNLSFQDRWLAKKGKNTHIDILELKTVWMACQRFEESMMGKTISFQIVNTTAVAYLLKGGRHSLQNPKWSCGEDPAQVSQEWGNSVPKTTKRCGKPLGRCPFQWQECSRVELREPNLPQVIWVLGNFNSGSVCKQSGTQDTPILQSGSLRQESIWGRCLERGQIRAGSQRSCA